MREVKALIIIIILLSFVSCSPQQTKIDPKKNYKLDAIVTNKDLSAYGSIVLREKPLYEIVIETDQKIDWISFRSCSREVIAEDPRTGISRKKFSIAYLPNEIERTEACPVKVQALNVNGMYSMALIAFENKQFTIPAENICGSKTESSNGVSVCSERASSVERIKFTQDMIARPDVGCELNNNYGKVFDYIIKSGFCNIVFMEVAKPNRLHILYTYGYDEIQTRI